MTGFVVQGHLCVHVKFFEIEIYTSSEIWINNMSIDVWFVTSVYWMSLYYQFDYVWRD